jgi:two-component system sensor histidine kinase MtrB
VRALGSFAVLALGRIRLFEQEHEARLALERADRLKTDFIALAAHELRNPVANANGIVLTLDRHRERIGPEQQRELERQLGIQTGRLALLVEQLLDLSRLDAQAVAIDPQPIPVRAHVERLVGSAAGDRTADVEIEVDPRLETRADVGVVDHVVVNLLENALKYGSAPIRITASRSDNHFRLAVEDSGAGVPDAFVSQLFERFTRADESRERGPGTGLGLAIARSYARAHRGDLLYRPAAPGGAHFELVLPSDPL